MATKERKERKKHFDQRCSAALPGLRAAVFLTLGGALAAMMELKTWSFDRIYRMDRMKKTS